MNELQVLKKTSLLGKKLTVYGTMQEPLFLAKDVASMLGMTNVTDMVSRVDDDEVTKLNLGSQQGECNMLTENGIYEVLMQSRKPIAKKFKKGVKGILHEIRTNGGYIAEQQNETPEEIMARALKVADITIQRHKQRIQQLEDQNGQQTKQLQDAAPKVQYVDDTLQSVNTLTTTQVAKEMGMDAHKLNKKLAELGILFRQSGMWMLTAKYQDKGYTKTRTQKFTRSDGSTGTNIYTVWTEKGRMFLHQIFKEKVSA